VFKKEIQSPKQMPVKHQLMTLVHFIGREGEINANHGSMFNVSEGHCETAQECIAISLINLREEYIRWPNEGERKQISGHIEENYPIPNCVCMVDDTLLELGIIPCCNDKDDYSGRKFCYSLTVNVINDNKRRARGYLAGFLGTTHHNNVWRNMSQCQRPHDFFSQSEYHVAHTANMN
jgi:hypothetical protein